MLSAQQLLGDQMRLLHGPSARWHRALALPYALSGQEACRLLSHTLRTSPASAAGPGLTVIATGATVKGLPAGSVAPAMSTETLAVPSATGVTLADSGLVSSGVTVTTPSLSEAKVTTVPSGAGTTSP